MLYRASTDLEAANLALGEIGEPPIGSFQDASARARAIARWYGIVLDAEQRAHDWNFCSAHIVPPMHPVPALGHLKNRFIMPDDCLQVREVVPYRPAAPPAQPISITDPNIIAELEALASAPLGTREWNVEGASVAGEPPPGPVVLVTNLTQPLVRYTRRTTIVRLWDALFTETFAKKLGAAIAPAVAKDLAAAERKGAEATAKMDEATRNDSREQSPRHVSRDTSWVRSRMIGSGWGRGRGIW